MSEGKKKKGKKSKKELERGRCCACMFPIIFRA